MPPLPDEESLVTLFADVHYYFSAPSAKPVHDRFNRGSYVYLYNNPRAKVARIEVANHAGTPEQDAFNGRLNSVLLEQRNRQPNLITITVDARSVAPASEGDVESWRLPAFDLKHEQKYRYRIHTMDVYFWTANDAAKFLETCRRIIPEHYFRTEQPASRQSSTKHGSHHEHRDALHPVVQQLEQAAISDPYQPKAISLENAAAESSESQSRPFSYMSSVGSTTPPSTASPAPYNPAAPAAPEQIAHREKTPPPPEAATGTGLAAAAVMENPGMYAGQMNHATVGSQQIPYFQGPPQSAGVVPLPSNHPGSPGVSSPTMAMHPGVTVSSPITTQYATVPQHLQSTALQSPSYTGGMSTYSTPLASPMHSYQIGIPPPPASHPGQPAGPASPTTPGFSHYTYGAAPPPPLSSPTTSAAQHQQPAYSFPQQTHHDPLHATFYTPTEAELAPHGGHLGSHASLTAATLGGGRGTGGVTAGQSPALFSSQGGGAGAPAAAAGAGGAADARVLRGGRLEEKVGRVEKGVNKWLKRLDQKI